MRSAQAIYYLYWVGALGTAVIAVYIGVAYVIPWNILISYFILKLTRHGR